MEIDTFEYPVLWTKVSEHKKSNLIGKLPINAGQQVPKCGYCGRQIGYIPNIKFVEDIQDRYAHYGPNCVLYFTLTLRIIIFMTFCALSFMVYAIVANLQGNFCQKGAVECSRDNLLYHWSLFNIINNEQKLFTQVVLWDIIIILMMIFNYYLRVYITRTYNRINNINVTDEDYCIILRRLPDQTRKRDIYRLFSDIRDELTEQQRKMSDDMSIRDIIMIYKTKHIVERKQNNLDRFKKSIKEGNFQDFQPQSDVDFQQFANVAIVRFNSIRANEVYRAQQSKIDMIIHYCFPFFSPRSQYEINGHKVSIEQAPQPTDIVWSNFGYSEKERVYRKILYSGLILLCLAVSAGITFGLAKGSATLSDENGEPPIYMVIIQLLVTNIFNILITIVIEKSTQEQKIDTLTDQQVEHLQKAVVFQNFNLSIFAIFVPFFTRLPNLLQGIKQANLPLTMLLSITINGLIGNFLIFIIKYSEIISVIKKIFVQRGYWVLTQCQANLKFEGPKVNFVENYSFKIQMIWLGFMFAIVSPICLPLAILAISLNYLFEKILFAKRYSIPSYGGFRFNSEFIDQLDMTPLLISGFHLFLYSMIYLVLDRPIPTSIISVIYLGLGLGIFNFVIPWSSVVKLFDITIKSETENKYDDNRFEFVFQELNPATRQHMSNSNIEVRLKEKKKSQKYDKVIDQIGSDRILRP